MKTIKKRKSVANKISYSFIIKVSYQPSAHNNLKITLNLKMLLFYISKLIFSLLS